MAAKNEVGGPEKSREEVMKELLEAESKIDAWQRRIVFEESKNDEAEAQLDLDTASLLENSEDPVLTKKLWHNSQNAIIANIEKGPLRSFALNEKGLFLRKRANTTDQKFSYKQANQMIWDLVDRWIRTNATGNPFELGMTLWDLNRQFGHHNRKSSTPQVPIDFDQKLKDLLHGSYDKKSSNED